MKKILSIGFVCISFILAFARYAGPLDRKRNKYGQILQPASQTY